MRDLDVDVQQKLRDAAAREGLSLSALLRRELTRLADQLTIKADAEESHRRNRLGVTGGFFAGMTSGEIVSLIRADRDR